MEDAVMLKTCIGDYKTDITNTYKDEYNDILNCCPNGGLFTGPNPVNRVASLRSYFIPSKNT